MKVGEKRGIINLDSCLSQEPGQVALPGPNLARRSRCQRQDQAWMESLEWTATRRSRHLASEERHLDASSFVWFFSQLWPHLAATPVEKKVKAVSWFRTDSNKHILQSNKSKLQKNIKRTDIQKTKKTKISQLKLVGG